MLPTAAPPLPATTVTTVHGDLEFWAARDPGRVCVEDGARWFSYREMNDWADEVAGALRGLGLATGDRVGVLARNGADLVAVYYGAFKAGVVPVPLNVRLHPREWAYLLRDSGASAVLAQPDFVAAVDGIRSDLVPGTAFVVVDDPPAAPAAGWSALSTLTAAAAVAPRFGWPPVAADHDLWQMYTSGTTGRPKGAVLTHAAVRANAEQFRAALSIGEGDRVLVAMPLFHVAATLLMTLPIAAGATMRLVEGFDPSACARIIDEEGITCAPLAPTMIQGLLAGGGDLGARRFASLRTVVYGASPIAETTLRQAMKLFDCDFVQGYGQTEAGGALKVLGADAHHRALAGEAHLLQSCGRAMDGTQIAVVDGAGTFLPPGAVGEIVARGPQVMRGYWNRPDATADALRDGWLHTGDAGRFDDEGFLYLCDRINDMIISGGENIYSREIEDVIAALPEVAEVAVIGVPDDRWGEVPKAFVVARPDTDLAEQRVIDWCRSHLAGYKAPRSVAFVDALPRTGTGKVRKVELRRHG